jgi:hypothetical protein
VCGLRVYSRHYTARSPIHRQYLGRDVMLAGVCEIIEGEGALQIYLHCNCWSNIMETTTSG